MASPAVRLKRRAQFLRVAAGGRKAAMPGLVLQALARGDAAPARLGFTVTRKVGNAVVRNRTRRRLREAARLLLRDHPAAGADLVLVGRDTTRTRPFHLLVDDLRRALAQLGVPGAATLEAPSRRRVRARSRRWPPEARPPARRRHRRSTRRRPATSPSTSPRPPRSIPPRSPASRSTARG